MRVINVDKSFTIEKKYTSFLEDIQKKLPDLQLQYIKSFSTDLSISFQISFNDKSVYNIEAIIKKIYSFN